MKRFLSLLFCLSLVLALIACVPQTGTPANPDALFAEILAQTEFASEMSDVGDDAQLYYAGLPAGATVRLYMGSGYFADEAALILLASEQDVAAAQAAIEDHIAQKRNQFLNYIPGEVGKLDKALIRQLGTCMIVCITDDLRTVENLLKNPSDPAYTTPSTVPATEVTTEVTTEATAEPTTEPTTAPTTEPTTAPTTEPTTQPPTEPDPYPTITSQSGTWHTYSSGVFRVDDHAYEPYLFSESAAVNYADVINRTRAALDSSINVYDLLIPTAVGVVLPDDIRAQMSDIEDQNAIINHIYSMISDDVIKVNCFDNLMRHRDEYLYFRTDYHWNGTAAYYAYETFCQMKGVAPYTLDQREEVAFDGFLGALYELSCGKDPILAKNPDTVYAYKPASPDVTMVVTTAEGGKHTIDVIRDVSGWTPGAKYLTFAGADNPFTEFTNPAVTDGSVAIVIKESFGNAMMSYFVDHYAKVYEIDYRYWDGNLADFAHSVGATDVIFTNNMSMTRSNYMIGLLGSILN